MSIFFPDHLRKKPSSLRDLAASKVLKYLQQFVDNDHYEFFDNVDAVRHRLCTQLPASLRNELLANMVPSDRWIRPCLDSTDRLNCSRHPDCARLYRFADRILRLLFTPDIESIDLNLMRINRDLHIKIIRLITDVISQEDFQGRSRKQARCPSLTTLVLSGGTAHSDRLLRSIEKLSDQLRLHTPNIHTIQLPIISNHVLRKLSGLKHLVVLRADRTLRFDSSGLHQLSDSSRMRKTLQTLHLGVFKNRGFTKVDVMRFFVRMAALRDLSFLDNNRALIKITDPVRRHGEKVYIYAILRMSMVYALSGELSESTRVLPCGRTSFGCNLTSLSVIDRQLKPHYLLESCPNLTSLNIEWQEVLSQPPYSLYEADWFSLMLQTPEWLSLGMRLKHLAVRFPSTESATGYNLPLQDSSRLISSVRNLVTLKLVGVGLHGDPLPVLHVLRDCRCLHELHLEKCRVYIPDVHQVYDESCVHPILQIFKLVGDHVSLRWHPNLGHCIAVYMPNIVQLEIQPGSAADFEGYTVDQLPQLAPLANLQRLSYPLSMDSCIMNMPAVLLVLRQFKALRQLIISWGFFHLSFMNEKIKFLTWWLSYTLKGENANFSVQLDYLTHPNIYGVN